jgi:hypothetical protein
VFSQPDSGVLRASPIPWSAEAKCQLPLSLWQSVRERHWPNRASVSLDRALYDDLHRFQVARGLLNLDEAVAALLRGSGSQPNGGPT